MRERAPALALLSLVYAAAARLALAPLRRLSPDEAYYVCAARRGWPIVDHPPLLGSLLTLVDRLPLSLEMRTRGVAVLLQAATALLIGLIAGETPRDRRFAFGVFFATWGLMPWVSGLITTPDAPLLAATAGAFLFALRRQRVGLFLCVALAVAAKATGGLVALAIAFDLRRRDRLGAGLALLGAAVAMPLVFRSLVAQAAHVVGRGALVSAPHLGPLPALGALVGGALLLFGPAACFLSFRGRQRLPSIPGALPLFVMLGGATVISALSSGRPPEPNWIAPAFVPLFAIAAIEAESLTSPAWFVWLGAHVAPAVLGIGLWSATQLSVSVLARVPPRDQQPAPSLALPPYGRPAWACLYEDQCERINVIFNSYERTLTAPPQGIPNR